MRDFQINRVQYTGDSYFYRQEFGINNILGIKKVNITLQPQNGML